MTDTNTISKGRLWAARIMSGIVILFMLVDSIMKFIQPEQVVNGTVQLGYSVHHLVPMGILGLVSVLLYAYPKTCVLGAILLTGYWGGAIATHLRVDDPVFTHTMFPFYFAILAWGGIWLRNQQLRALMPFQGQTTQPTE